MGIEGVDKNKETGRIDYPWGYGLGYNYGDGNQYGLWRVEVSPRNPSTYDNFLNVLQPVIKGKKGLKAELIESEDRDLVGVRAGRWAVLFSRKPEPLREGSYTLSGTGLIRQLLCNLQPGSRYRIKKDGKVLSSVTATKQGTARFETDVDGSSRFEFSTF